MPKGLLRTPPNGWPIAAEAAGLDAAPRAPEVTALGAWLDRLVEWNARMDLTAARSAEELVDLSLADAFVLCRHLPDRVSVVDVGSGAGAPGLPLAVLRRDLRMTLVEPLAKRTAFLRTALVGARREDVQVVRARGEAVAEDKPGSFDVAVSRATLRPIEWLALGRRLVRDGGDIWVLLARADAPETDLELKETIEYAWPLTAARRRMLRYVNRR